MLGLGTIWLEFEETSSDEEKQCTVISMLAQQSFPDVIRSQAKGGNENKRNLKELFSSQYCAGVAASGVM